MAIDKAVDSAVLDAALVGIANAIRGKTGDAGKLTLEEMPAAIAGIQAGGGGASGIVLVDETVTLASNGTTSDKIVFQSEKLKNLDWYFALFVKLNPVLASGAYEVVQISRNSDFLSQAARWTGSGYSANHAYSHYLTINESGEVCVRTNNTSTMPLLAGDYRLIVIM